MHTSLSVIALAALGVLLIYLSFLLIPLVLGAFLAYFLEPIVDLFVRRPLAVGPMKLCKTNRDESRLMRMLDKHECTRSKQATDGRGNGNDAENDADNEDDADEEHGKMHSCCKGILLVKFPRFIAVVLAFSVLFSILAITALIVASNVSSMLEKIDE